MSEATAQGRRRRLPPLWVMGMTNATFGLMGGFAVVTLPAMLAAQGLAGGRIAAITATVLSPGFWVFLVSPVLDVRFSRRLYALVFSVVAALAAGFTVVHHSNVLLAEAVMMAGYVAASLVQGAVGGWMGSLVGPGQDGGLGAWFSASNVGAGGLMILVAGQAVTRLRPGMAGLVVGGMVLLPSLLYVMIPEPAAEERRRAGESFRRFGRELAALAKRREVLLALLLFVLPSASFAMTDVLGGIGGDFRASERMVGLLAGVGSTLAGIVGSLLLPPLSKRLALRPLYLGIGIVGAMFTLGLLLLPRAPWAFAVAMTGENLFQALAFATSNAITFEVMGPGNPLAATLFSVLIAAANLAIVGMGFVDGWAYTAGGLRGSLLADAGISVAVCVALLGVVLRAHPERSQ